MKTLSGFALAAILASGAAWAQAPQEVRLGNVTANDTVAAAADKFAELITRHSKGRLKATAHHGESLGNAGQLVRAMQAGSVHGALLPSGFLSALVPELSLFDLPFLLPAAPAKITAFAEQSNAAREMAKLAEEKGIHFISFHGIGGLSFLTNFPVTKLADIQGKKFRVIASPPRVGAYKDWGAIARTMELGEVYTALQQRTVDGMENPPDVILKMKMYEAAKYYTVTEHFVFVSSVMVSKKWYDALPMDLKDAVTRAGKETTVWADDAYTRAQNESLEAMKKVATVSVMPPAEIQKMKDLGQKGIWETMRQDPKRGPFVRMLEQDVANFNKTAK